MERVLEIATRVSTPIAVAGLIVGVLLILFYAILKLRIFPKLNQQMGKDLLSSMMNYLYRLAMVSIILGSIAFLTPIVLAAIFPHKPPAPDSAKWIVKFDYTLKAAIERVAEIDGKSVFIKNCSAAIMKTPIKKTTYTGTNYSHIIYQLQHNLDAALPLKSGQDIYKVSNDWGYYEIVCHN